MFPAFFVQFIVQLSIFCVLGHFFYFTFFTVLTTDSCRSALFLLLYWRSFLALQPDFFINHDQFVFDILGILYKQGAVIVPLPII